MHSLIFRFFDFSDTTFRTRIDSKIKFSPEAEYLLFTGDSYQPDFNSEFPAKLLSTNLEWDELVLPRSSKRDIDEILMWFKNEKKFTDNLHLSKWLKPGYRVLFHGPSGTGKTLTASLLGKTVTRPVYRVDLSMVVSKYIGETEKNLAKVFERAENNNWILFFDEADALFGKRTEVRSSNDRYVNQNVGYLLQRIEDFPGLIILAMNRKKNIDEAFLRRFQLLVDFRMPDRDERERLWKQIFSGEFSLSDEFVKDLAENYELSGGSICNILRRAVLQTSHDNKNGVSKKTILTAIKQEFSSTSHEEV